MATTGIVAPEQKEQVGETRSDGRLGGRACGWTVKPPAMAFPRAIHARSTGPRLAPHTLADAFPGVRFCRRRRRRDMLLSSWSSPGPQRLPSAAARLIRRRCTARTSLLRCQVPAAFCFRPRRICAGPNCFRRSAVKRTHSLALSSPDDVVCQCRHASLPASPPACSSALSLSLKELEDEGSHRAEDDTQQRTAADGH